MINIINIWLLSIDVCNVTIILWSGDTVWPHYGWDYKYMYILFSQTSICITFLPIGFCSVVFVQLKIIHGVKRVNRYGLTVHLGDSCVINSLSVPVQYLWTHLEFWLILCVKHKHLVVMLVQTVVILWLTKL